MSSCEMEQIAHKLQVPAELNEHLKCLKGLCTYSLLDRVRFGEYKARDSDIYAALSRDWTCMGDELLALDKATHVPRDHPDIQRIFRAIRSIPEWLVAQAKVELPDLEVEIYPMGSYTCDVKVIDVNEFDFLLISNDQSFKFIPFVLDTIKRPLFNKEGFNLEGSDFIKEIEQSEEVHILGMYLHGPGACIELSWRCTEGHTHEISVDITAANRIPDSLKTECESLRDRPVVDKVYESIGEEEQVPVCADGGTTCELDVRLCEAVKDVSDNTLVAYRLLKVLTSHLLPSIVDQTTTIKRYVLEPFLNSHSIKQVLFEHVISHPTREEWDTTLLPLRLAEMVHIIHQTLSCGKTFPNVINDSGKNDNSAMLICSKVKRYFIRQKLKLISKFESLQELRIYLLGNDCQNVENVPTLFYDQYEMLLLTPNCVYPCKSDLINMMLMSVTDNCVYKVSSAEMIYRSHPLMTWCHRNICKLYQDNKGFDLTTLPESMYNLVIVFIMANIINGCDLKEYGIDRIVANYLNVSQIMKCDIIDDAKLGHNHIEKLDTIPLVVFDSKSDVLQEMCEHLARLLHPRERAFILLWCQMIADIDILEDFTNKEFDCSLLETQDLKDIVELSEKLNVLLANYFDGVAKQSFILPYAVVYYLFNYDTTYFKCIEQQHAMWADWTLKRIVKEGKSFKIYNEWEIINIKRDDLNLYRCFSTYVMPSLRSIERTGKGDHWLLQPSNQEIQQAHKCKEWVQNQLDPFIRQTKLGSFTDSQLDLTTHLTSDPTGLSELASLSFILKTQFNLYEEIDGELVKIATVPEGLYTGPPPISLLYKTTVNDRLMYNLMLPKCTQLDIDLPEVINSYEDQRKFFASRVSRREQLVPFEHFLSKWASYSWGTRITRCSDKQCLCECADLYFSRIKEKNVLGGKSESMHVYANILRNITHSISVAVIRNRISSLYKSELKRISQTSTTPNNLYQKLLKREFPYTTLLERMRVLDIPGIPGDFVDIAAIAFLGKVKVNVYENRRGLYRLLTSIPHGMFNDRPQLDLLYKRHQHQHFDRLVKVSEAYDPIEGAVLHRMLDEGRRNMFEGHEPYVIIVDDKPFTFLDFLLSHAASQLLAFKTNYRFQ